MCPEKHRDCGKWVPLLIGVSLGLFPATGKLTVRDREKPERERIVKKE